MTLVLNTLFEVTVYSAIIFGAVWIFRLLLRKHVSPSMLYIVWFLLIARLLVPVTMPSGFSLIVIPAGQTEIQPPNEALSLPPESAGIAAANLNSPQTDGVSSQNAPQAAQSAANETSTAMKPARPGITWETALLALWLAGVAAMLAHTAVLSLKLKKRLKGASPVPPEWMQIEEELKADLRIRQSVRTVMITGFPSPALSAGLKPVVILPAELLSQSDETIRFALLHELTHIKRKDHIVCILLLLLRAVYWFNPVVWLTVNQMRLDMESACDSRLVKPMNNAGKKRYAGAMLSMYARQQVRFALGMAPGQTKKTAARRLRGVFMRGTSSRMAKMASALLAAVLLFTCFTTACQPTPEMPAAVDKADEQPEEQISQISAAPHETYEVPDNWQDVFSKNGGNLIINVDADIKTPSVNAIPVYKIASQSFTQTQVDKMIELLFKGAAIEVNSQKWTKSQYEDFIAGLKKQYATTNDTGMTPEEYEASIAELERRMQYAPDSVEKVDVSVARQLLSETNRLDLKADMGKKQPATLTIFNGNIEGNDGGYIIAAAYRNNDGTNYSPLSWDKNTTGLKLTEDEAKRDAKELVTRLGSDYMDIAATDIGVAYGAEGEESAGCPRCYLIYFTRTVDGVPTTYDYRTGDSSISDTYESTWAYERITVGIDDSGIVQFDWEGNASLGDLVTPDAQLLPFENIQDAFVQSMESIYAYPEGNSAVLEFHIDRIVLGMTRVKNKDGGEYRLVPVWDFFGTRKADNQAYMTSESILTLNALDGSVIDRSVGY